MTILRTTNASPKAAPARCRSRARAVASATWAAGMVLVAPPMALGKTSKPTAMTGSGRLPTLAASLVAKATRTVRVPCARAIAASRSIMPRVAFETLNADLVRSVQARKFARVVMPINAGMSIDRACASRAGKGAAHRVATVPMVAPALAVCARLRRPRANAGRTRIAQLIVLTCRCAPAVARASRPTIQARASGPCDRHSGALILGFCHDRHHPSCRSA